MSLAICACYMVFSIFLFRTYNAYKIGMYRAGEVFYAQMLANLFSSAITYLFACLIRLRLLPVWPVLATFCGQTIVSAAWCLWANKLYFRLHPPMKTLVLYETDDDFEKLNEIVSFENRFDVQKKMKSPGTIYEILPKLNDYQAVIVSGIEATLRNGIVKACIDKDIDCYFIPHTGDVIIAGAKHLQSFSIPIMSARRAVLRPEYAFAKRTLDALLAALGLVIASPVMLITAIAIKAYDNGPVIYRQVRLTKDGKPFEILKFRSMRVDAEKDGVARLAADQDSRITPVGRIIRTVHFDELPQLWNILQGDMSIVGPRPERPEIAAQYEQEMPAFSLRLQVKAGLTGTARALQPGAPGQAQNGFDVYQQYGPRRRPEAHLRHCENYVHEGAHGRRTARSGNGGEGRGGGEKVGVDRLCMVKNFVERRREDGGRKAAAYHCRDAQL